MEIKGALEAIQLAERKAEVEKKKESVRRMDRKLRKNAEKIK